MDKTIQENSHTAAETVIGPSATIQGDLTSDGDIQVAGQVSGKITTSQTLLVISGGKVEAEVIAGAAIVNGEVQGKLTISGLLAIQSTAKISGDIACNILHVEDRGAIYGQMQYEWSYPHCKRQRQINILTLANTDFFCYHIFVLILLI